MDLSQEEWTEQLAADENAFILDVRTPEEVEEGYIPGAKNIDIYPDQTDIRLREALVQDFDNQLTADQFITGNSGSEVIDMILSVGLKSFAEFIVSHLVREVPNKNIHSP